MHGRLTSEAEILVYSCYEFWFSKDKVAENWKCPEWPQTEIEHLTVKSTL